MPAGGPTSVARPTSYEQLQLDNFTRKEMIDTLKLENERLRGELAGSQNALNAIVSNLEMRPEFHDGASGSAMLAMLGPLRGGSEANLIPKESCPLVTYYKRSDWDAERKSPTRGGTKLARDNENVMMLYIEDINGTAVDGITASLMRAFSRSIFATLDSLGLATARWSDASHVAHEQFCREMRVKYPQLRYCDDDWKAEGIAGVTYSKWYARTHTGSLKTSKKRARTLLSHGDDDNGQITPGGNEDDEATTGAQDLHAPSAKRLQRVPAVGNPLLTMSLTTSDNEDDEDDLYGELPTPEPATGAEDATGTEPVTGAEPVIGPAAGNGPPSDSSAPVPNLAVGATADQLTNSGPSQSGNLGEDAPVSTTPIVATTEESNLPPRTEAAPVTAVSQSSSRTPGVASSGGTLAVPNETKSPRNLCMKKWVLANPGGLKGAYAAYWDSLGKEERKPFVKESEELKKSTRTTQTTSRTPRVHKSS
ncbi:hypothetical protein EUX98_g2043 [Antrodiella citrinella]|uniref:Uncharacterized protein n=1 Tax=Antrodiella citrinella TaxID=2447956 RepID=A0A4S4N2V5_9APHY|nr:hypothetical protein EUX98_g2043 [Antrodiella citrinella]